MDNYKLYLRTYILTRLGLVRSVGRLIANDANAESLIAIALGASDAFLMKPKCVKEMREAVEDMLDDK